MAEEPGPWSGPAVPPPGWQPPRLPVAPYSGMPARPRYQEPYAIGAGPVLAGLAAGLLWFVLFGAVGRDLVGYAWSTLCAAVLAWVAAAGLAWFGDRGAAVGVAASAGLGWAIAVGFVVARWVGTGDWPMW